jgi:hypothetical protein
LLFALIVPVTVSFLLDQLLGTSPVVTIGATLVCIPLATVLVSKQALRDLNRVIAEVAPPVTEDAVEPFNHLEVASRKTDQAITPSADAQQANRSGVD